MTARLVLLYPFLLVVVRVLYLAAESPGHFTVGDLVLVLAVMLALVALVYALAALVLRGRGAEGLPALVTYLAMVIFLGLPGLEVWLTGAMHYPPDFLLSAVCFGASTTVAYLLASRPRALRTIATFITLTYGFVAAWLAGSIVIDLVRARQHVAESALARELAGPIRAPASAPAPNRDVYLIVLDEYANSTVLREVLGFDNRAFEDSLRALGFHVPAVASNYAHTMLSLPSLLNTAHVERVGRELPRGSTDPTLLDHLLAHGRVPRFFRERGYRFVLFPSSWWKATRSSPMADSVVRIGGESILSRELYRTELRRILRQSSAIAYLYEDLSWDRAVVRGTLEGLARLPSVDGPVLAFAHVMSPHLPYVFNGSCGVAPPMWGRDPAASYLAQLQCLNRMVLGTVTRLIRDSEVPPIILLQSDHGTATLRYSEAPRAEQVPAAAARERLGAFGAYYLPENGAAVFGDTVTVVNVLGHVLRRYFGAKLQPEPDELYLSLERAPFEFARIEPTRAAGPRLEP